jgi:RNA polymerase sigma-70 factor, ECF subfamily
MLDCLSVSDLQHRWMTETLPKPDIVSRAQSGDVAAFRLLYQQHHRQVLRQLRYLVAASELEDVLQEVFVQVFRSLPKFERKSSFSTWLYRITIHVAMKVRRKRSRKALELVETVPDRPDEQLVSADDQFAASQRHAQVELLLQKLSPKKRAVLVMHDLQGMEAAAIAEVLETNVLTVRTRLFYARRELEALALKDSRCRTLFEGDSQSDEGKP